MLDDMIRHWVSLCDQYLEGLVSAKWWFFWSELSNVKACAWKSYKIVQGKNGFRVTLGVVELLSSCASCLEYLYAWLSSLFRFGVCRRVGGLDSYIVSKNLFLQEASMGFAGPWWCFLIALCRCPVYSRFSRPLRVTVVKVWGKCCYWGLH